METYDIPRMVSVERTLGNETVVALELQPQAETVVQGYDVQGNMTCLLSEPAVRATRPVTESACACSYFSS